MAYSYISTFEPKFSCCMRKTRFPRAITMIIVLVLTSLSVFSQNRLISGVVSDQSGAALVGATVAVKGGKTTVITDNYGAFKISVPSNATALVVSYVGAKAREISLEGKTNLLVSLDVTDTKLS